MTTPAGCASVLTDAATVSQDGGRRSRTALPARAAAAHAFTRIRYYGHASVLTSRRPPSRIRRRYCGMHSIDGWRGGRERLAATPGARPAGSGARGAALRGPEGGRLRREAQGRDRAARAGPRRESHRVRAGAAVGRGERGARSLPARRDLAAGAHGSDLRGPDALADPRLDAVHQLPGDVQHGEPAAR